MYKYLLGDSIEHLLGDSIEHLLYESIGYFLYKSIVNLFYLLTNYSCNKQNQLLLSEDCFICCSTDGKTDKEIVSDKIFNHKSMNYPLLQLSNVYGCHCNSIAHNKCLFLYNLTSKSCPMCRKLSNNPNLYKKTLYDYYLYILFKWIKKDITRIDIINNCAIFNLIMLCVLLLFININYLYISIFFKIGICIIYIITLYIIIVLDDYFKKYWLYPL